MIASWESNQWTSVYNTWNACVWKTKKTLKIEDILKLIIDRIREEKYSKRQENGNR